MKKLLTVMLVSCSTSLFGQGLGGAMTLNDAIKIAHQNSPNSLMAELNFMSQYWNYRSYKAQMLPSLNLDGSIGNYNRSLVEVRDPETGRISYVSNNTLSNDLSLSIIQRIALTGGTISVNSYLSRLDQFTYDTKLYNSNPITVNYSQPIRAFNSLKWQKKTSPLQYDKSKRDYLESMENITIQTTNLFFSVLSAQKAYKNSVDNLEDTRKMYKIAIQRADIAKVSKSELLQIELSTYNNEMSVSSSRIALETAMFNFKTFLGIQGNTPLELISPSVVIDVNLDYDFVLEKALSNSSHTLSQKIKDLNAQKSVAEAKARRGIQMTLNANLGFSQNSNTIDGAYANLKDREVVGLKLSMPIYDWGMSSGQVKMAQAQARLVNVEIEQEESKFRQDLRIKVLEFGNQSRQCELSLKALVIAEERYNIMKDRFQNGGVTVTDLNTAQKEYDNANDQYTNQLRTFWSSYYELRKATLYDFINKRDLSAEFDKIVEK